MFIYEPILIDEIIKRAADPERFVTESEKEYESKLDDIALNISRNSSDRPFILISGPSGSGKTTSGMKLEERLDKMHFKTHIIFFKNDVNVVIFIRAFEALTYKNLFRSFYVIGMDVKIHVTHTSGKRFSIVMCRHSTL